MELVFDGGLFVHYGFVFFSPADDEDPDLEESRRGQLNGLLGAASGRALSLMTGTHTGEAPIRIEWHDGEPSLDEIWDDVVEASVDVTEPDMRLAAFEDARDVRLPVIGSHRVRLCATGFEAASREEDLGENDMVPDRYLLQLWPAPAAPDVIVRVSGPAAQYWHDEAAKLSSMSEDNWAARQATSTATRPGGGYEPWEPVSRSGNSDILLLADIPMSLRVELREPLARRACEAAGIAEREPIRSALQALRKFEPLPRAMRRVDDVVSGLRNDDIQSAGAAAGAMMPGPDPIAAAVGAVLEAVDPDCVMNMMPLLVSVKGVTGKSGEELIREVCAERGYPAAGFTSKPFGRI